jgi:hypothetical protein
LSKKSLLVTKRNDHKNLGWVCWYTAVVPATEEAEAGGSLIQGQPRQSYQDPISDVKYKTKGLGAWLKT